MSTEPVCECVCLCDGICLLVLLNLRMLRVKKRRVGEVEERGHFLLLESKSKTQTTLKDEREERSKSSCVLDIERETERFCESMKVKPFLSSAGVGVGWKRGHRGVINKLLSVLGVGSLGTRGFNISICQQCYLCGNVWW